MILKYILGLLRFLWCSLVLYASWFRIVFSLVVFWKYHFNPKKLVHVSKWYKPFSKPHHFYFNKFWTFKCKVNSFFGVWKECIAKLMGLSMKIFEKFEFEYWKMSSSLGKNVFHTNLGRGVIFRNFWIFENCCISSTLNCSILAWSFQFNLHSTLEQKSPWPSLNPLLPIMGTPDDWIGTQTNHLYSQG